MLFDWREFDPDRARTPVACKKAQEAPINKHVWNDLFAPEISGMTSRPVFRVPGRTELRATHPVRAGMKAALLGLSVTFPLFPHGAGS